MGIVYQAEDLKFGPVCGSEVSFDDPVSDPHAYERVYREGLAASALNHPNICMIDEVGEQQGSVFIAMKYLEGHGLRQLLRGTPI